MAQVVAHLLTISLLVTWESIPVEGKAGAGAVFRHFKKIWGTMPIKPVVSAVAAKLSGDFVSRARLSVSPREPLWRLPRRACP